MEARGEVEIEVLGALVVDAEADLAERVAPGAARGGEAGGEVDVAGATAVVEVAAHAGDGAGAEGVQGGGARLLAGGEAGDALVFDEQQFLDAVAPGAAGAVDR